MENVTIMSGATAPELVEAKERKELDIPSFITNNKAKHLKASNHAKSTTGSGDLHDKITEFVKDASDRERGIAEDLELILDTIMKYGAPDKIKLNCTMEYDSGSTRKNKVFTIKR